jgi:hypothetical protein
LADSKPQQFENIITSRKGSVRVHSVLTSRVLGQRPEKGRPTETRNRGDFCVRRRKGLHTIVHLYKIIYPTKEFFFVFA